MSVEQTLTFADRFWWMYAPMALLVGSFGILIPRRRDTERRRN
jgi:hypothetical protein